MNSYICMYVCINLEDLKFMYKFRPLVFVRLSLYVCMYVCIVCSVCGPFGRPSVLGLHYRYC